MDEVAVLAVPIEQRLRFAPHGDGPDAPDENGMGVPVDRLVQFAIQYGQRIGKGRGAGHQLRPLGALIAIDAFNAAPPSEAVGNVMLVTRQHIDRKGTVALRTGQEEELRLRLTRIEGGSMENEDTEVAVKPLRSSPCPTVITLTAPAR